MEGREGRERDIDGREKDWSVTSSADPETGDHTHNLGTRPALSTTAFGAVTKPTHPARAETTFFLNEASNQIMS